MRPLLSRTLLAVLLAGHLSGCIADGLDDGAADDDATSSAEEALHGPVTWSYDSVGRVIAIYADWKEEHCTGTLIGRQVVLTAAHCVGFKNAAVGEAPYDMQFDMKAGPTSPSYSYAVDGWRVFGKDAGPDDLAILHLTSPVTEFTPAALRRDEPSAGEAAAAVGYGIYDCLPFAIHHGHEDQHRRVYHYTWGHDVKNVMCGGDSGGPTFTNGRVAQVGSYVNSHGTDHFGHVWRHYAQIEDWLALWHPCPSC